MGVQELLSVSKVALVGHVFPIASRPFLYASANAADIRINALAICSRSLLTAQVNALRLRHNFNLRLPCCRTFMRSPLIVFAGLRTWLAIPYAALGTCHSCIQTPIRLGWRCHPPF